MRRDAGVYRAALDDPPTQASIDRLCAVLDQVARGETWPHRKGEAEPGRPSRCTRCRRVLTPDNWCGFFSDDVRRPGNFTATNLCNLCYTPRGEMWRVRQRRLAYG